MKKILLFFVVGLLLFGHASVFAEKFDSSDLEGSWYLFDTTVDPATPAVFWTYGKFDSDASGNVLSGSYYVPDGSSFTVSAGQMMIDKKGVMNGTATVDMGGGNTATVVFPHGKLDGAKTNGALVSLMTIDGTNNTSMGVGSFIKGGGTFTQADLEGEWYGQGTLIELTQGAVIPVSGIFNIDQDGNVINGSYTAPNGITGTVDPAGSKLGVTGNGLVSGAINLLVNFPPPVGVVPLVSVVAQGKMDQSKRSGSLVTRDFDPTMTNLLTLTNINLVKGGGSFAGTETAGTWYTYSLSVDPSIPAAYWIRGQYRIDSSGSVSEGFYVGPDGTVINATSGAVSLDNKGVISGNITTEGGQTDTVNGKVDQGKTYGTFGTVDNAGWMNGMETGTMFKDTYKSWALVLPAITNILDSRSE